MATPGIPVAGYNSRVQLGGVNCWFEKWSVTPKADEISATSFEDVVTETIGGVTQYNCYEKGIMGVRSCDIQASGYCDSNNNPHASPLFLIAGSILSAGSPVQTGGLQAALIIWVNKNLTNNKWTFTEIRILTVPVQSEVKGRVDFSFTAKSNGQFTYPQ